MPGYTDLPPDWVWAVAHWAVIIAMFSPIILPLCIVVLAFIADCFDRRPRCSSCGRPWH